MAHEKYAGWGPEVAPPPGQVPGQPAMPSQQQVPGQPPMPAQQQVPGQPAMPAQQQVPGQPAMPAPQQETKSFTERDEKWFEKIKQYYIINGEVLSNRVRNLLNKEEKEKYKDNENVQLNLITMKMDKDDHLKYEIDIRKCVDKDCSEQFKTVGVFSKSQKSLDDIFTVKLYHMVTIMMIKLLKNL